MVYFEHGQALKISIAAIVWFICVTSNVSASNKIAASTSKTISNLKLAKKLSHRYRLMGKKRNFIEIPANHQVLSENIVPAQNYNNDFRIKKGRALHIAAERLLSLGKKRGSLKRYRTISLGKRASVKYRNMSFGKRGSLKYRNISFGKRAGLPPKYRTMSFGKRGSLKYHNMSFGKRDGLRTKYRNMSFGKRGSMKYRTMSLGKRDLHSTPQYDGSAAQQTNQKRPSFLPSYTIANVGKWRSHRQQKKGGILGSNPDFGAHSLEMKKVLAAGKKRHGRDNWKALPMDVLGKRWSQKKNGGAKNEDLFSVPTFWSHYRKRSDEIMGGKEMVPDKRGIGGHDNEDLFSVPTFWSDYRKRNEEVDGRETVPEKQEGKRGNGHKFLPPLAMQGKRSVGQKRSSPFLNGHNAASLSMDYYDDGVDPYQLSDWQHLPPSFALDRLGKRMVGPDDFWPPILKKKHHKSTMMKRSAYGGGNDIITTLMIGGMGKRKIAHGNHSRGTSLRVERRDSKRQIDASNNLSPSYLMDRIGKRGGNEPNQLSPSFLMERIGKRPNGAFPHQFPLSFLVDVIGQRGGDKNEEEGDIDMITPQLVLDRIGKRGNPESGLFSVDPEAGALQLVESGFIDPLGKRRRFKQQMRGFGK